METNGGDATAQLAARVAELEAALHALVRRWQNQLAPRLAELERDVGTLLEDHRARDRARVDGDVGDTTRGDEP